MRKPWAYTPAPRSLISQPEELTTKEMCSYFRRQGTDARQPGISRSTASYTGWCVPGRRMPMNPSFLMSMEGHNYDFADRSSRLGDTAALFRGLGSHTMLFGIPGPAGGLVEINMVSSGEDGGVTAGEGGVDSARIIKHKVPGKVERRPCSIFAKVPQVSDGVTAASSVGSSKGSTETSPMLIRDKAPEAKASSVGCPLEREGLQIASSRPPGIKKRKDQAKKVVCIPAQPAASNKPSGEVVPSDLWAWRKYGQKPIKGSPYPRGYYRCSSSKGCSARKQVERSRTDPSMLVITYTSEHNHPWPTQRNALAGSTRSSQPTKNSPSAMKSPPRCQGPPATVKAEHKEAPSTVAGTTTATQAKEESPETEMKAAGFGGEYHHKLERVSIWDCEPMLPEWTESDDLFADLGELTSHDTMGNLVFSEEFLEDKPDEGRENTTTMDPFNIFDWAANSFGETVRRVL